MAKFIESVKSLFVKKKRGENRAFFVFIIFSALFHRGGSLKYSNNALWRASD